LLRWLSVLATKPHARHTAVQIPFRRSRQADYRFSAAASLNICET